MKIRSIETFKIVLPFRFSFGHALATRAESSNLIVKVTLDNGCFGFGEAVPRDYVTGETTTEAENNVLLKYWPHISSLSLDSPETVLARLKEVFNKLGLREARQGASWCALELAILDTLSRLHGLKVMELLGRQKQERIRYGGVVPFGKRSTLTAMLYFYKFYGFGTVKLKVGAEKLEDDLECLRLARRILGPDCILRVDANCAWTLENAERAVEAFRPFRVSSYEQPLQAEDWSGLQQLSASIEEDVVVDESLCTIKQAEELAAGRVCNAFNIRLSKVGGMLAAQEMIEIALKHGLRVHLGAQVGESGILSAAARQLAFCHESMENYEGSANFLLLKRDICCENLTAGPGGFANLKYAGKRPGFGLSIPDQRLLSMVENVPETTTGSMAETEGISDHATPRSLST